MKILFRVVVCCSLALSALLVLQHWVVAESLPGELAPSTQEEKSFPLEAVLFSEWFLDRTLDLDAAPLWLCAMGADADSLVAYRDVKRERERCEELDKIMVPLRENVQIKNRILGRLLAGQVELLEAAKQFRACDQRSNQGKRDLARSPFPGRTELEKYCLRVLAEVEHMAEVSPKNAALAHVVAGLRSEFQHLKDKE